MDTTQKKSPEHLCATKQARRKETHPAQGSRERRTGDSARGENRVHGSWPTDWSSMAEGLIGVQVDGVRVPPGPRADGQHDHEDQSQPGHGSVGFCRGVNLGRAIGADQLGPDAEPVIWPQVPAANYTTRHLFDSEASAYRDRPNAMNPMIDRWSRRTNELGKLCLATRQLGDVVGELHSGHEFSAMLTLVNSATAIDTINVVLKTHPMLTTIEEIYRSRLKLLIKRFGKQAELAKAIGKSPSQISQWVNASPDSKTGKPRCMERQTAREIERMLQLPDGWMDQPVEGDVIPPTTGLQEKLATYDIVSFPSSQPITEPSASSSLEIISKFMSRLNGLDRNIAKSAIEYLLQDPSDQQRLLQVKIQIERLQHQSNTDELRAYVSSGSKQTGTS